MERARLDATDAEGFEPTAHLAGRLVRERDGEDLPGREGPGRDLVRDPACDRRGLAGARTGQDADRPADELGRAPLLGVQAVEDGVRVHPAMLRGRSAVNCDETVPIR